VGGRFSALSAFGLVPAGLAGADIQQVVDEAADAAASIRSDDEDNPALQLSALLVAAHARDVRTLAIAATDPQQASLPAWLEQLIAESTGKDGLGFLPVTCESVSAHGFRDAHAATALVFVGPAHGDHQPISGIAVSIDAPLGAQFLLWETAVALVGAQLGVDPFDQPDVEAAKQRTRALLDSTHAQPTGSLIAIAALLPSTTDEEEYLAVQAFLSPGQDGAIAAIRELLARKSGGTVAFSWGPRYLHSTGQFHKGGRPAGSFLFLAADPDTSPAIEIPEAGFSFAQMQLAQAQGDGEVLSDLGRAVVTLLLRDRTADISRLLQLLEELPDAPARLPEPEPISEPEPEQELESEESPAVAADDDDQEEPSAAAENGDAGEESDSETVESETDERRS
jgi:glucose-6-phosphate isomerase